MHRPKTYIIWDRILLCGSSWPETHYVDWPQTHRGTPASSSQMLRVTMCATSPGAKINPKWKNKLAAVLKCVFVTLGYLWRSDPAASDTNVYQLIFNKCTKSNKRRKVCVYVYVYAVFSTYHARKQNIHLKNKTEVQPLLHTRPQINMIYVTGLVIKSTTWNPKGQCFGGWEYSSVVKPYTRSLGLFLSTTEAGIG